MTHARPFLAYDRVRWADVDLVGIMRYSAFTRLIELAEQEMWREAGQPFAKIFQAPTTWLPRRHLEIDYFAPVKIDDALTLVTYVSRIGETSLTFNVDVRLSENWSLVASTVLVTVCVTVGTFAKCPLPSEVRTALSPFAMSAEQARSWTASP
jgi:YbgC/YbaW family acyl-CoA thioester hydrolase